MCRPLLPLWLSYPMRATLCLMYSDAWPMPRGNMTRVFGPIPATLGGSCRGEPADGMMADRAPRNREPAVSISSDWFSLLHCWCTCRQAGRQKHIHREWKNDQKREKTDIIPLSGQKKLADIGAKLNSRPAKVLFFPSLTNWFGRASGAGLIKRRCRPGYAVELALFEKHSMQ